MGQLFPTGCGGGRQSDQNRPIRDNGPLSGRPLQACSRLCVCPLLVTRQRAARLARTTLSIGPEHAVLGTGVRCGRQAPAKFRRVCGPGATPSACMGSAARGLGFANEPANVRIFGRVCGFNTAIDLVRPPRRPRTNRARRLRTTSTRWEPQVLARPDQGWQLTGMRILRGGCGFGEPPLGAPVWPTPARNCCSTAKDLVRAFTGAFDPTQPQGGPG